MNRLYKILRPLLQKKFLEKIRSGIHFLSVV